MTFFRQEADDMILHVQQGNTAWGVNLHAIKRVVDEAPDEYVTAGARNWRAMFEQDGLEVQRRIAEVYEREVIERQQAQYPLLT